MPTPRLLPSSVFPPLLLLAHVVLTSAENVAPPPLTPPSCSISFSPTLGDSMVLQRAPASAAVYGSVDSSVPPQAVVVTVANDDDDDDNAENAENGNSAYSVQAELSMGTGQTGKFKALLRPAPAGGSYTVSAECVLAGSTSTSNSTVNGGGGDGGDTTNNGRAVMTDVTFGDVWYCAGQSNMALSLQYTTMRNVSLASVEEGQYDNIRIHGLESNMNPRQEWRKAKDAVSDGTFFGYSSTCWYFGEGLTKELLSTVSPEDKESELASDRSVVVPPIGLVHTGWGGTMIEDWLNEDAASKCTELCSEPARHYDSRVVPYLDMSIKGWVWYQGENNMYWDSRCILGNPLRRSGYACLQVELVRSWREVWSRTPGTTDPHAPFGIVALPNSGKLGGISIGTMRWAQTGGYGVLPNPSMPATFLVQAYDQDEPYASLFDPCWKSGCCYPEMLVDRGGDPEACDKQGKPSLSCDRCDERCSGFCANFSATHSWMGPIHPRTKHGIGSRLGAAAARSVYAGGRKGEVEMAAAVAAVTGPTLSGCAVQAAGNAAAGENKFNSSSVLRLLFNDTLLGPSDSVRVQSYDRSRPALSKLEVLIKERLFCLQYMWHEESKDDWRLSCFDDGSGGTFDVGGGNPSKLIDDAWVPLDIVESLTGNGREVIADLSRTNGLSGTNGTVYAVRYMWQGDCCDGGPDVDDLSSDHCPLGSCPIMGHPSGLPANPFIAMIVGGRCECIAPQECNEDPEAQEEEDQE